MSEREALLRAVCANPDDDTPRLVFADWLQENGEEARAEFIRVQIELARLAKGDRRRARMTRRSVALQEEFGDQWMGELPKPDKERIGWTDGFGWLDGTRYDRGFAQCLFVQTAGLLAKHAEKLFNASPVRRLLIWNIKRGDKLAKMPQLRHLHTIRIRVFSKQAADDLLECPYLDAVPDIRFSFTALSEAHIERLRNKFGDRFHHQP